jgi:DNA topoisomerase-1
VDTNLVDAQQARRVLDRIVGYKISPLLWNKVRRGLSAGRVQSVALRLIVEREQEIRAFVPQEYWSIHAMMDAGEPPIFEARLVKYKGEDIEIKNQEGADAVLAAVKKARWQVAAVTQKEKRRNPPPPFTTSKLQQAAYNRLRYTAKRTMGIAQRLYEGVELGPEGSVALITYMRTDSVNVSRTRWRRCVNSFPSASAPAICRRSRTTTNPKRMRRKRTKRCARPTYRARRKTSGNISTTISSSSIS